MAMALMKAQMLWDNIAQGSLSAVHSLLESGNINLEERDENGQTFLMVAAEQGELNIVRELLEAGLDPNAVDNENWSALLCAAKEGHLEIVIELLEHGAGLEHRDLRGWTALMWASYKGRTMVVHELLDRGANPNVHGEHNMTSLIFASGRGHAEVVKMLLEKGAKVNIPDKYGTTPLIWACRKGFLEIVEALLSEGANVDACGMHSWTALLVATKGGFVDVVHALLEQDPNVNAIDKDGYTPLAIAAKEGLVETVAELLNKGAYINVADRANDTVLIHAVKAGHGEVVQLLLAKHADVDVCGSEGRTALYAAVEKNHADIVQRLLSSGPDLEIATKDGDTSLLKAVRNRNEPIVRMLLDKGAKVSAADKKGDTPLHIAIRARSKRITELLLRDPRNSRLLYRPNKAGETPYNMDSMHQRGILPQIFGHRQLNANDAENLLGYEIYSGALADILSEPSMVTPITVGLYAKWGSGKSFLINKLQGEMKAFTAQSTEEHLQLGVTVFFLALLVSLVIGETLGLSVSWKVGLGVGLGIFFLIYIILGAVVILDERYDIAMAERLSVCLAKRFHALSQLLQLLFLNPQKPEDKSSIFTVKFLFSSCTRLTSVGGEQSLAAMIATLCESVEDEYGLLVTRLFRVFRPHMVEKGAGCLTRFKSLLCVPHFLIFAFVLLAVMSGIALLVVFPLPYNSVVLGILIALACIIGLTLISNLWTWARAIAALARSQKTRVYSAAEKVNELKLDGFMQLLKHEVDLMADMVNIMDAFTKVQTRLVVIVDGLDSCEQEKVLNVLDTVKMLFSDDDMPFIVILAVDPQIIIKGIDMTMRSSYQDLSVNGFDYLRNVVQLPFYLQSQGMKAPRTQPLTLSTSDADIGGRPSYKREESITATNLDSVRQRRKPRNRLGAGSQVSLQASSFDLTNTLTKNDYFSDINPRSMRRLLNIAAVTARLLRAYNIEFNWHRLAAWNYLIENWPYRVSWIIYHFEEEENVDNSTTLYSLYQRVAPQIPATKDMEPLLEIDRNVRKLEAVLKAESGSLPLLNVGDLKKFLPCTINLDPYLRKIIRDTQQTVELQLGEYGLPIPPTGPPEGGPPGMGGGWMGMRPGQSRLGSHLLPPTASPSVAHIRAFPRRPQGSMTPQYPMFPYAAPMGVPGMPPHGMMMMPPGPYPPQYQHPPSPTHLHQPLETYIHDHNLGKSLSKMTVAEVCELLQKLEGLNTDRIQTYSATLQEHNITGLVLMDCPLDELRDVLQMRFGDWQLFRSMVLALREADSFPHPLQQAHHDEEQSSPPRRSSSSDRHQELPKADSPRMNSPTKVKEPAVPKKGSMPRLKRADSIVQQLTMESALLANALEEFSPDDEEEEEEKGLQASNSSDYVLARTHIEPVENHTPPSQPTIPDIVLTKSPSLNRASFPKLPSQAGSTAAQEEQAGPSRQGQQEKSSPPHKPILKQGSLHRTFTPLSLREREAQEEDLRLESSVEDTAVQPLLRRVDESPAAPTTSQSLHSMSSSPPKTVRSNTITGNFFGLSASSDISRTTLKVDSARGGGSGSKFNKGTPSDNLSVQSQVTREESYCSLDRIPSEVFTVVGQEPPKSLHILVDMGLDLAGSSDEQDSPSCSKAKSKRRNTNQSNPSVPPKDSEEETSPKQAVFTLEDEDASSPGSSNNAKVKRDFETSVEQYFRTKVKDRRSSVTSVSSSKGDKESFV